MMRVLALAVLALTTSGCVSIFSLNDARGIALDAAPDVPENWETAQARLGPVETGWIAAFDDPQLTEYVKEALANNRDLRAAAAAVEEARTLARQAGAALLPAIDITGTAGRVGVLQRPSAPSYGVGAQLNWEIDVWRRVRATREAAALSAYSAEADYVFSQYSIAAAVAQTYFTAIEARLQLEVSRRSFEALAATDRIVVAQRELGAVSGLDVALSKRDLANARDAVLNAEGAVRIALRGLGVLLGRYPGANTALPEDLPTVPAAPPAGAPSSLLERRPDIVAAEIAVAAASNNVSAQQAARLPSFALTSTIGGSSSELEDVLDPENVAWQVVANMLAPTFDAGLRKARVDEARAERAQAVAAYAQTAIDAFQEVETSLDQNVILRARVAALEEAAAQAGKAFSIAQSQYREGASNLLDVLVIQTALFNAESALVGVRSALLQEWIALNLALGGSWEEEEPKIREAFVDGGDAP
ncbi:MAG: efflux transporter outer membrane subunit [Pseudomonadota bacterium]